MAYSYNFTQYNDPGVGRTGGIRGQWLFTSDVVPYTDEQGLVFAPAILAHDAISLSQEKSSGQVHIRCALDFPVARLFRLAPPAWTIWVDVHDVETGSLEYTGVVKNCKRGEIEAQLLLSTTADMLNREGLRDYWQAPCQEALYSEDCGVDQEAKDEGGAFKWRTDGAVVSVSADGLSVSSPAFATRPAGFFDNGKFVSNGQRKSVVSHTGDTVVLMHPLEGLAPGATFSAYKGCNVSIGAGGCSDFGNTFNFSGTPYVNQKNIFITGIE